MGNGGNPASQYFICLFDIFLYSLNSLLPMTDTSTIITVSLTIIGGGGIGVG